MEVAVGLVVNSANQVLITKRSKYSSFAAWWEFPGGKLEAQESPKQALIRELLEEVNLQILQAQPVLKLTHKYQEHIVILHVFLVTRFNGLFTLKEQQLDGQWVSVEQLNAYQLLPANQPIVDYLNKYLATSNQPTSFEKTIQLDK